MPILRFKAERHQSRQPQNWFTNKYDMPEIPVDRLSPDSFYAQEIPNGRIDPDLPARECLTLWPGRTRSNSKVTLFSTFVRSTFMKIFFNTSIKSLAAAAALMFFASSAAYATCQEDCHTYANAEAERARASAYSQIFSGCSQGGGSYYACQQYAITYSQQAYNGTYNNKYYECVAANCGG